MQFFAYSYNKSRDFRRSICREIWTITAKTLDRLASIDEDINKNFSGIKSRQSPSGKNLVSLIIKTQLWNWN